MNKQTSTDLLGSSGKWWAYLLMGALMLFAGVWLFSVHEDSLLSIDRALSYLILAMGIWQIITVYTGPDEEPYGWWKFIIGAVEIILGVIVLLQPGISFRILMLFLGLWLLFRGLFLLVFSFRLKRLGGEPWLWLLVGGIVVGVLGVCVVLNPTEVFTRYFWLALGALAAGVVHVMLGWQLKRIRTA